MQDFECHIEFTDCPSRSANPGIGMTIEGVFGAP